jgi:hypothetical protein
MAPTTDRNASIVLVAVSLIVNEDNHPDLAPGIVVRLQRGPCPSFPLLFFCRGSKYILSTKASS